MVQSGRLCLPAPGLHGNLGRNIAFGPCYYEIDTALQKEFGVTERLRLRFRVEAFNAANHPYWTDVNTTLGQSNFGQVGGVSSHVLVRPESTEP